MISNSLSELDIRVISNELDEELFFNKEYFEQVKKAVAKLKEENNVCEENISKYAICCHYSCVELFRYCKKSEHAKHTKELVAIEML